MHIRVSNVVVKIRFAAGYRKSRHAIFPTPRAKRRFNAKPTDLLAHTLSLLVVEDIRVTSVQNGHGGAAEELAAGGAELDLLD